MATVKGEGWLLFDRIIKDATKDGHTNPWRRDGETRTLVFEPDYPTLQRLLGVPLLLGANDESGVPAGANSQSGVPALALDVWVAYERRRAGFAEDAVWPRASVPRILPSTLVRLLGSLPRPEATRLRAKIESGATLNGAVGASAKILGKNYVKQVDVVVSAWDTGPEILISTKRMDSSFGKNAANRVEESYGDAKNLRSRHPQAALGFVYALRSTALETERDRADWLIDLLAKLGREDDAYDAVALIIPKYAEDIAPVASDAENEPDNPLVDHDLVPDDEELELLLPPVDVSDDDLGERLTRLPAVELVYSEVPYELSPGRFFEVMISRVLDNCPITFHREARARIRNA